jgi:hypothetical protein
MEAHTWQPVSRLRVRGHRVTVRRGVGSHSVLAMPAERFDAEHRAYSAVMPGTGAPDDVVQHNSLHHLPVAMAGAAPVRTVLHTPPTPWPESAVRLRETSTRLAAVSASTAARRRGLERAVEVVRNGVDTAVWTVDGHERCYGEPVARRLLRAHRRSGHVHRTVAEPPVDDPTVVLTARPSTGNTLATVPRLVGWPSRLPGRGALHARERS